MALAAKLQQKQSQSLVMTPQLLQSIRLLQFGSQELAAYIAREVEKNPLLEIAEEKPEPTDRREEAESPVFEEAGDDWLRDELVSGLEAAEQRLGSAIENVFDNDIPAGPSPGAGKSSPGESWKSGSAAVSLDGGSPDLESYCAAAPTLREHLLNQLPLAFRDPADLMIGRELIESLDDDGYLRRPLTEIEAALGVDADRILTSLGTIQSFDPAGIGGRDLPECLAIQLREKNRLDPAMQMMLANLELLGRRDYAGLARLCGVSADDIVDMAEEIRDLDPRPGSRFASDPVQTAVPDIFVDSKSDGGWSVELNSSALPKLLVDREYYAKVSKNCRNETEKSFMIDCLQTANWLVKSIDQRAQTILKVAAEIVKQQDMFLVNGVEYLKPLNLRMVAEAISMHESTVSRVTASKYMMTPRGLFELKYFFTAPISSTLGTDQHSAESVRYRIRQLVDAETPDRVLSDDTIVKRLRDAGIEIARRTVAKYRESMSIPSSVQRRREKQATRSRRTG